MLDNACACFPVHAVPAELPKTLPNEDPNPFLRRLPNNSPYKVLGSAQSAPPLHYQAEFNREYLNGLVLATDLSFAQHTPLALSPDHLWIAILQGYAIHCNKEPESVRAFFTDSAEKKDLICQVPPTPDWPEVGEALATLLGAHIGEKKVNLLSGDFSTTTPVERMVQRICMMQATAPFYNYFRMHTLCGIPYITLLGCTEDWTLLRQRAVALMDLGAPEFWKEKLLSLVLKFEEAARGNADTAFFREFYTESGGSGGPFVAGSINALFPYTFRDTDPCPNTSGWGPNPSSLPKGLGRVEVPWDCLGRQRNTLFVGGFTGATYKDNHFMPTVGWAILESTR